MPVVLLLVALALAGDARECVRSLLRMAPQLEPEVARHVLDDDTPAFRAFCRTIGIARTQSAMGWLYVAIRADSPTEHARLMRVLHPLVMRIADAMDVVYDRPEYARLYSFRASLGDQTYAHRRAISELERVQDSALPLAVKLRAYESLARRFERWGDAREFMTIEAALAREVTAGDRLDLRMALLITAMDQARRFGESVMICQLAGEIADGYSTLEQDSAAVFWYRDGIRVADAKRIPDQAARLRLFLGTHLFSRGCTSAGLAMLRAAQDECRRLGGTPLEARIGTTRLGIECEYHCWSLMWQELERCPALIRALKRDGYAADAERTTLRYRFWRASWLANTGYALAAADSLAILIPEAQQRVGRQALALMPTTHVRALTKARRLDEALDQARTYRREAAAQHVASEWRDLAMAEADAALDAGDLERASRAVDDALRRLPGESGASLTPSYKQFGMAARIALARGDHTGAELNIEHGMRALWGVMRHQDRGALSDRLPLDAEDLYLAATALNANDPIADLRFELGWKALIAPDADPAARFAGAILPPIAPEEVQLLYAERASALVRWTRTSSGMVRETLRITPAAIHDDANRMLAIASQDPGREDAPFPGSLVALADSLGQLLLPQGVRAGEGRRVTVVLDGELSRLPFALLDTGERGRYRPLGLRHLLVYGRPVGGTGAPRPRGDSIVYADASGHDARESLPRLPGIEQEVAAARRLMQGVRVIHSGEQTRAEFLGQWQHARWIYLAAHLVRDPEDPLSQRLPVAFATAHGDPEEQALDVADVRRLDLRRCALVVLSTCASGEPFVLDSRVSPSMADAFLDAGAHAAIQTRWQVRDDEAARLGPGLARAWLDDGGVVGPRWLATCHGLAADSIMLRHPFAWAAWCVTERIPVGGAGTTRPPDAGALATK
jgi:hypothetical protein